MEILQRLEGIQSEVSAILLAKDYDRYGTSESDCLTDLEEDYKGWKILNKGQDLTHPVFGWYGWAWDISDDEDKISQAKTAIDVIEAYLK